MRVSITLHTDEPDQDGNQRDVEASYCGYNRAYAELVTQPSGDAVCEFKNLEFPKVQADPEVFTHFSLGVCIAPAGQGGSIIIVGPLEQPIDAKVDTIPRLTALVGVRKARLDTMRADGRIVDSVKPDRERGTNLDQPG